MQRAAAVDKLRDGQTASLLEEPTFGPVLSVGGGRISPKNIFKEYLDEYFEELEIFDIFQFGPSDEQRNGEKVGLVLGCLLWIIDLCAHICGAQECGRP